MQQSFKSPPFFNFQECFNPFLDIDTVPERPKNIPPYNSRNQSSLGELLLGFLKYYATSFRYPPTPKPPESLEFQNPCVLLLPTCFSCPHFLSPPPPAALGNFLLPLHFAVLSSFCPASFSGFVFVAEWREQVVPLASCSTPVTKHDVGVFAVAHLDMPKV